MSGPPRAGPGRRARAAALAAPLLLAACCDLRWQVLAHEARARLEARARFAVLATTLEDPAVWAFADPPAAARALAAEYRSAAAVGSDVAPAAQAPAAVAGALEAARAALVERGYAPAAGASDADLVVLVTLTTHPDGAPARVAIHAGGLLDGRFRRDLVGLSAALPAEGACAADPADLVRALVGALPARDPAAEPAR